MPFSTLRRTTLALALVAPLSAAHPTEPPPPPPSTAEFEAIFDAYDQLPAAPTPVEGAVDVAMIEHTHDAGDDDETALGSGNASYYASRFHGRRTASGERFDMEAMTAAHRTLPFGSMVRVTNPANGRSVVVRINDRGPFHKNRTIDVSRAAAERLGLIARGHGRVELALLD